MSAMWLSAWRMTLSDGLPISTSASENVVIPSGFRTSASTMASAASAPYFSSEVIDAARTEKSSERSSLTCFLISSLVAGATAAAACFSLREPDCDSLIEYPPLTEPPATQRQLVERSTGKNYTLLNTRLKSRRGISGKYFCCGALYGDRSMSLVIVTLLALQAGDIVDLSKVDPGCGVTIAQR